MWHPPWATPLNSLYSLRQTESDVTKSKCVPVFNRIQSGYTVHQYSRKLISKYNKALSGRREAESRWKLFWNIDTSQQWSHSIELILRPAQRSLEQELSYRKQIARQLRTQYVEGIYDNPVILKSRLTVTQGHWKLNHGVDHTRLTISRVIGLLTHISLEIWVRSHSRLLKLAIC